MQSSVLLLGGCKPTFCQRRQDREGAAITVLCRGPDTQPRFSKKSLFLTFSRELEVT